MSPEQEKEIIAIGWKAANDSRIEDKDEAFSVALVGLARGLKTYVPGKGVKLTTYLYSCAKFECWAEWRKLHRIKRGRGVPDLSIEELEEKGRQF